MAESTLWWLLGGALVAIELLTGTFYLLMLAIGAAAGALAAHAGLAASAQFGLAAVVGGASVFLWHLYRKKFAPGLTAGSNRDVNLDIGETVQVDAWAPDGTTTVKYRGAQWLAVHATDSLPSTGAHRIMEMRGSHLVLEKTGP